MKTISLPLLGILMLAPAITGAQAPPKRGHHALAYDPSTQRVILTGGSTPVDQGRNFEFFNDLWAFDGARWTALPSSGNKVSGVRLAFDTKRSRMMSFGGFNGQANGDLRALDHGLWITVSTLAEMPTAESGLVYDVRRDRLVAFGGGAPARGQAQGSVWEFDGTNWAMSPASAPPARQAHAMVYDASRGRTIVFGGMGVGPPNQPPPVLGDLWEYDGTTWTQITAAGPTPRHSVGIAYDSKRHEVILFGGDATDGVKNDTWSWNGTRWKRLAESGPPPRSMGSLAYDPLRDRVVMFGGRFDYPNGDLNDTWVWDGAEWKRIGG